jgi:hypothetical protein
MIKNKKALLEKQDSPRWGRLRVLDPRTCSAHTPLRILLSFIGAMI